jgi:hypothetical protein
MGNSEIQIEHHYDNEADVLYFSFGGDEPCYTENIDDFLMLEIGWFSRLPRGFRILGPKVHNLKGVAFRAVIERAGKQFVEMMEERRKEIEAQEPVFTNWLATEAPNFSALQL